MKIIKRLISTLVIISLITIYLPVQLFAGRVDVGVTSQKISAQVTDSLKADEFVDVLIILNEQADTKKAAADVRKAVPAGMPEKAIKKAARVSVVNTLKKNAEVTQKSLINLLSEEQEKGNVKEFREYYIVNLIYAKVNRVALDVIAQHADVGNILPNNEFQVHNTNIESINSFSPSGVYGVKWNLERINAPLVWNQYGITGDGVVIGIIDTGVDWHHEALREKWRGYDGGSIDPDFNWFDAVNQHALPIDLNNHGTHVTGTILGSVEEMQGYFGVAPEAKWIAANAFGSDGTAKSSDILAAAQYMLAPTDINGVAHPDKAPDVINNSWGGNVPGENDEWFRPMVQAWRDAQILPVFAAGNLGTYGSGSISHPANYPESFSVAATDNNDYLAMFSSRGPSPYFDNIKPDISAPGVQILSSITGGEYGYSSGTSMAAPHVAGVAALLLEAKPELTIEQLEEVIKDTSRPLEDQEFTGSPNFGYGYGLIDAFAAVSHVLNGSSDVPVSGVTINYNALNFKLGENGTQLTAKVEPSNASEQGVVWKSSNESVAKVIDGFVYPVDPGMATIEAITVDGSYVSETNVRVTHVNRIFGFDRYSTATTISESGWTQSQTVVLARGDQYADALAGVPLAYQLDAPILLTRPHSLPTATKREIGRLQPERVIILGGTGAISEAVEDELIKMGLEADRIAGKNRFDTAASIAQRIAPYGLETAIVATGFNFPDALAVASYAAREGYPIVLTRDDVLPEESSKLFDMLGVKETIVVGGTNVISDAVLDDLPGPKRLAGRDRFSTAVDVADYFAPDMKEVFIATGGDYADAITGAVLAARNEAGILLVRKDAVPDIVRKFITDNQAYWVTVLGGSAAVNSELDAEFWQMIYYSGN
ncbi:S8 family serine peptidase [Dethiobacter alkaliphilus]|uniref:Peptidase S8 and S53 subtilisin kexin sedolisin n=1 Tax=Dethiobacter alkaliphilus AHT 1 TaxID=555088 RepID=C0GGL8_DETAL|nr:S8 family serine peptidase [Dethiobacter alkaliphilus]EEG77459.1 peptidase S8 and S53 subtilisin kexin sedolisin [Dethiobacter alkaliphilus AHT 1]